MRTSETVARSPSPMCSSVSSSAFVGSSLVGASTLTPS
jgi:hypothetical protein